MLEKLLSEERVKIGMKAKTKDEALEELVKRTLFLKVLGSYPRGKIS